MATAQVLSPRAATSHVTGDESHPRGITQGAEAAAAPPEVRPTGAVPTTMDGLLRELRAAFDAEKSQGFAIHNRQDPTSFARLNARVKELLKGYSGHNEGCWKRYAFFCDTHYVRNLVEGNEDFELLVLCWKGGQVSRVHNHADSHCWLACLDGEMREILHKPQNRPDRIDEDAPLPTAPSVGDIVYTAATRETNMRPGDVGYINDRLGLHAVGCFMDPAALPHSDSTPLPPAHSVCSVDGLGEREDAAAHWVPQGGVTLHLYSPPIQRVRIFENKPEAGSLARVVSMRTPGFYSKGGVRT